MLDDGNQYLIEAKRQRSPGSTDEKLPYVYANALKNLQQGRQFILVMDGQGWKPGAVRWIENKAQNTEGFYVMSEAEFLNWVRSNIIEKNPAETTE